MKKGKLSFKGIALVASLALAGLFGISALSTNTNTNAIKQAEAYTPEESDRVFYYYIASNWETSNYFFYNGDSNSHCFKYYGDDITSQKLCFGQSDSYAKSEIIGNYLAKITVKNSITSISFHSSKQYDTYSGNNRKVRSTEPIDIDGNEGKVFVLTTSYWGSDNYQSGTWKSYSEFFSTNNPWVKPMYFAKGTWTNDSPPAQSNLFYVYITQNLYNKSGGITTSARRQFPLAQCPVFSIQVSSTTYDCVRFYVPTYYASNSDKNDMTKIQFFKSYDATAWWNKSTEITDFNYDYPVFFGTDSKDAGGAHYCEYYSHPFTKTISYLDEGGSSYSGTNESYLAHYYDSGIGIDLLPYDKPVKTGYTFAGYYLEEDCSGSPITSIDPSETDDITLYVKWNINKHTVDWVNYDGTLLERDYDVEYGSTPTYNGTDPTKASTGSTYYDWTGWDSAVGPMPDNDVAYTAQFSDAVTTRARLYINFGWSGNPDGLYVGSTFGNGNQSKVGNSISADTSHHIPASNSGTGAVVETHTQVADFALSSSGQDSIFATFYRDENWWDGGWKYPYARWCPYRSGVDQSYSSIDGMNNGLMQANKVNFNNGYIYSLTGITYNSWNYNLRNSGKSDPYGGDEATYRPVYWYTYSIDTVGVFIHYDLDGGSFANPSTAVDIEHKYNTNLTLPAAPTKPGYTFMGWQASTNGILNRASTSFNNITQPMSFRAIWHSNTIQATPKDSVRVWIGYNYSKSTDSTLMYYGFGTTMKLWLHEGDGSSGTYQDVIQATGTYYNTNENVDDTSLPLCPRRYDYFDVPRKYFDNNRYMHAQVFYANGTYTSTSNQVHLNSTSNFAFKVFYVQQGNDNTNFYFTNETQGYGIATNKTDAMFAAIALAGMHSCSTDIMNGHGDSGDNYTGFSNWKSTFLQNVSTSGLSAYTIMDFPSFDKEYEGVTDYAVSAYAKYNIISSQVPSAYGGTKGLGYLKGASLFMHEDGMNSTIIIIIASSISILSITALSILLVKKRKSKEQ